MHVLASCRQSTKAVSSVQPNSLTKPAPPCDQSTKKPRTLNLGLCELDELSSRGYFDSSDQRSMIVSAPGVILRIFVAIIAFSDAVAFFRRLASFSSFSRR